MNKIKTLVGMHPDYWKIIIEKLESGNTECKMLAIEIRGQTGIFKVT